ncbi:unnamed protein product, partial [Prorocentrum cordatum]
VDAASTCASTASTAPPHSRHPRPALRAPRAVAPPVRRSAACAPRLARRYARSSRGPLAESPPRAPACGRVEPDAPPDLDCELNSAASACDFEQGAASDAVEQQEALRRRRAQRRARLRELCGQGGAGGVLSEHVLGLCSSDCVACRWGSSRPEAWRLGAPSCELG